MRFISIWKSKLEHNSASSHFVISEYAREFCQNCHDRGLEVLSHENFEIKHYLMQFLGIWKFA